MALTSPRFTGNARLQKASENKPAIGYGEVGEGIRLIQQALVDLGFPLPKSYAKYGSPDGIYGSECVEAIRKFQAKHGLSQDGSVGKQTMGKLDQLLPKPGATLPPLPPGGKYTHRLRIHMRSIAMPSVGEMRQLAEMERIYAAYGIEVVMASGMSLGLSAQETITLTEVDGDCKWDAVSADQELLQDLSRVGVGINEIVVYFATVLRLKNNDTLQGCASHRPGKPACMVASSATDPTTMAHEVGHVLLTSGFAPVHTSDSDNLMCEAPMCTGNPATLTAAQLQKMKKSPYIIKL